jgi:hypothetical protein
MGFNFINLAISVRTADTRRMLAILLQSGTGFADACRCVSCRWPMRECGQCSIQDTCDWYRIFGQELASDHDALKRHQKPSLPFVFSFPPCDELAEGTAESVIGLVVIGQAIAHLPMLLNGLSDFLSHGMSPVPVEIFRIACRDYQGLAQPSHGSGPGVKVPNLIPDNLIIVSTDGVSESLTWSSSDIQIRLRSPLRLIENGHSVVRFEFGRFARSVMRRVSSLSYYYGESELDCDFKALTRQFDDVICSEDRFCYTKNQNNKMTGITGYGRFQGDFSQFLPLLMIGSYVHTGKGATFGMGMYEAIRVDGSGEL